MSDDIEGKRPKLSINRKPKVKEPQRTLSWRAINLEEFLDKGVFRPKLENIVGELGDVQSRYEGRTTPEVTRVNRYEAVAEKPRKVLSSKNIRSLGKAKNRKGEFSNIKGTRGSMSSTMDEEDMFDELGVGGEGSFGMQSEEYDLSSLGTPASNKKYITKVDYSGDYSEALSVSDITFHQRGAAYTDVHDGDEGYNNEDETFSGVEAATPKDLTLGRIDAVGYSTQAAIKHVLMGGDLHGTSKIQSVAAREQLEELVGMSSSDFGKLIKIPEGVELPNSREDINTALSMLTKTGGEYLERGPGGKLAGNEANEEKAVERDLEITGAVSGIKELADLYIHKQTDRKSDAYASRHAQVVTALSKRFLDENFSEGAKVNGLYPDGSKSILPTPNELGIPGLVPTMSYGGKDSFLGTPFTPIEFSIMSEKEGWSTPRSGVKGELVRQEGETEETFAKRAKSIDKQWDNVLDPEKYFGYKPSVKHSLVKPNIKKKEGEDDEAFKARRKISRDKQFEGLVGKAHVVREQLRELFPTTSDESKDQKRMSGFFRTDIEEEDKANLRNEASLLDLDYGQASNEVEVVDHSRVFEEQGKGTDTGGLYGKEPLSEVDVFVEKHMEVIAEARRKERAGIKELDTNFEGIEQRTPEWYKAREGIVTASKLIDPKGNRLSAEDMALQIGLEKHGAEDRFYGNSYTKEGEIGEKKALGQFLAKMRTDGTPLSHEEVGLILNPDLPGMGASPDGKLFNQDGSSAGLLELKFLGKNTIKGAKDKYYPQMQLQMLVTGEEQTHFFAMDRYTDDSIHEIVKADPEYQAKLKEDIDKAVAMGSALSATEVNKMREDKIKSSKIQTAEERKKGVIKEEEEEVKSFKFIKPSDEPMTPFGRSKQHKVLTDKEQDRRNDQDDDYVDDLIASTELRVDADDAASKASKEFAKALKEASDEVKGFGKSALKVAGELASIVLEGSASAMSTERFATEKGFESVGQVRGLEFELTKRGGLTLDQARTTMAVSADMVRDLNDVTKVENVYTGIAERAAGSGMAHITEQIDVPYMRSLNNVEMLAYQQGVVSSQKTQDDKRQAAYIFGNPNLAITSLTGQDIESAEASWNSEEVRNVYSGVQTAEQTIQTVKEDTANAGGEMGGEAAVYTKAAESIFNSETAKAVGALFGIGAAGKLAKKIKKARQEKKELSKAAKLASDKEKAVRSSRSSTSSNIANSTSSNTSSKVSSVSNLSTKASNVVNNFSKSAGNVLSVGKPVSVLSVVPTAVRAMTGTEDDGSLEDSVLDIADFTAGGAMIGMFLGPKGAAVGAALGAGVGLANEAYQHFRNNKVEGTSGYSNSFIPNGYEQYMNKNRGAKSETMPDEYESHKDNSMMPNGYNVLPDRDLSAPSNALIKPSATTINNDLQVTVSVDPDMVRTVAQFNDEVLIDRHQNA